ncbi:MAG TPA: glycosyltransferase [Polyangiaceae bacterium]|jgi:alpha-1,6-mannosyltransferase|nr:glycosyltransferase [Polyangiaceae bacterium]
MGVRGDGALRLKIVDVTEFYSERGGGIRSHLTSRGHFLCQLGHDHTVIAPGPRDEDAESHACVSVEAAPGAWRQEGGRERVVRIAGPTQPYDPTYHFLFRLDKIRARVRADPPDVLEAHSPYLGMLAVAACGRPAPVQTAFWHSDHVGVYVQPHLEAHLGPKAASVLTAPLWRGVRALLAPFDAVFVAGRAQADHLRRAGVPNIVHVPFGVDGRVFRPPGPAGGGDREAARRQLLGPGAGPKTALLVGVGRFALEKRWDVVLEAYGRVRAARDVRFVLYGDGPDRRELEALAPPGVTFAGFVTDRAVLARALGAADALVHGCPYETYGLSVAEAMACGAPVVVPDAGGALDAADADDRRTAEVYASLDAGACAAAIERILARGDRNPNGLRAETLAAAARVPTLERHYATVLETYASIRAGKRATNGARGP